MWIPSHESVYVCERWVSIAELDKCLEILWWSFGEFHFYCAMERSRQRKWMISFSLHLTNRSAYTSFFSSCTLPIPIPHHLSRLHRCMVLWAAVFIWVLFHETHAVRAECKRKTCWSSVQVQPVWSDKRIARNTTERLFVHTRIRYDWQHDRAAQTCGQNSHNILDISKYHHF